MLEGHNMHKSIVKLNIFCFNPGIGFNDIIKCKPYSIILTSGTLAPFDILEDELKVKFDTTLENEHIIDKSQIKFAIIKGMQVNNEKIYFNFEYNKRKDSKIIASLGITILNFCKTVKNGGILVFFTSFAYLNECYNTWGDNNIISQISQFKTIFFDNKKNKNLVSDYKKNKDRNSILFSVFRGSSSEGIDYKDDYARMVICVGVPYASIVEEKILLKKKYLDKICTEKGGSRLNGQKWYINDAISNVNQTLGRIIRYKNDYGALICIDQRYEMCHKKKLFSLWIRDKCETIDNLDDKFMDELLKFYNEQNQKFESLKKEKKEKEKKQKEKEKNEKEKNENIIIKDYSMPLGLKNDENNEKNDSKEEKNNRKFDDIFKKKKKEIKYEFEETETNSNDNHPIVNEIKNEKDIINDLENKYLKIKYLKEFESLYKKTKLEEDINDYNNEDINPNQINESDDNKKINFLGKKYNYNNNKITKNENKIIINKNKEDLNNILDEMNKYENELDSKKNDLSNKKIEQMIINLDNNTFIKNLDKKEFFCVVCFQTLNDNPNMKYSISKCKHILCNECWARCLYEKFECPICKKKVREKTLIRLITNP